MEERKFDNLTRLMALLTFAVFAVCILLVLLSGSDVYRNLTEAGQAQYASRTAAQYITTRIRQAEAVEIAEFDGLDALQFQETVNGRTYLTRVYCYDGSLRELFTAGDGQFLPEDGEKLLRAEALSLSLEDGLLRVEITLPGGSAQTLYLLQKEGLP